MLDALAEFMPKEVHWTHPEGGLFVWATLPSYLDATAMLPRAIAQERRLRARRGLLRRRRRQEPHAAQLLVRRAGEDPARHRAPLRGHQGAHGAAQRHGTRLAARPGLRSAGRSAAPPATSPPARKARDDVARLVVLRGGHSMERDVSFLTGRRVQHALERLGHEVHPLDIEETPRRRSWISRPMRPSSACTAPAARTARFRRSSRLWASPTPGAAPSPRSAAWTRTTPSARSVRQASRPRPSAPFSAGR